MRFTPHARGHNLQGDESLAALAALRRISLKSKVGIFSRLAGMSFSQTVAEDSLIP
jgi:hypothetical protein